MSPSADREKRYFHKTKPVYLFTEGILHHRRQGQGWKRYRIVALSYDEQGKNLPSWKGADWWVLGVIQPWTEPNLVLLMSDNLLDAYAAARVRLEESGFVICEEWLGTSKEKMSGPDARRFLTGGVSPLKGRVMEKDTKGANPGSTGVDASTVPLNRETILFLAANPTDKTLLRLSEEAREIREELDRAGLRDRFIFHERGAVRPTDMSRTLIDLSPRYLHFSGHGGPSGAIYLEDQAGKSMPVSATALRALFRASGDQIHCVVLNACYSRAQADEILTCVPFVVGMEDPIGDKAAIAFARGFYRGIGAGRPVQNAFDLGIAEILIHSIPEGSTPVLLQR